MKTLKKYLNNSIKNIITKTNQKEIMFHNVLFLFILLKNVQITKNFVI